MKKKWNIIPLVFSICLVWANFAFADNAPYPAENYAPNFWFDSSEQYFPTDPYKYYYENGEQIAGDLAVDKYNKLSTEQKISNTEVFCHISETETEWVYEYWLFYVLNNFENKHYGDWETVFVFVDKTTGEINKVVGSAHGVLNNELKAEKEDNSNYWIYITNGSHANCPDYIPDGKCDYFSWNTADLGSWTKEDVINGKKVFSNSYVLKRIDSNFVSQFNGSETLDKSPSLGFDISGFLNSKENVYIPAGGDTPMYPWYRPEYDNPDLIYPTSVVEETVNNIFGNVANFFSDTAQAFTNQINSLIGQINPFSASLVPTQSVNFGSPIPTNSIIPEEETPLDSSLEDVVPEDNSNNDSENTERELSIQDQIDDILEKIDILQQQLNEMQQQEQEAQNKTEDDKNNDEDKDNKEEEQKTEEPEIVVEQTQQQSSGGHVPSPADLQTQEKLLIVEVQTEGDKSSYDFIDIYNPNNFGVYLKNYRLVKRAKTSTSDTTIKSWANDGEVKILANGYYLWASSKDGYQNIIYADESTSQTLADDNGIAIRFGAANTGQIVDTLGWGDFSNVLFEGSPPLPASPAKNKSLERKKSSNVFVDTDNNQQDFAISNNPCPISSKNTMMCFDPIFVETSLDSSSLPESETFSTDAKFSFISNKENSTFECNLDDAGFEACVSPKEYSGLLPGEHKFQVKATDKNGNIDESPESYLWAIKIPLPKTTIGRNPDTRILSKANFTVSWQSGDTNVDHYDVQIKIDNGEWQDWSMQTKEISKDFLSQKDDIVYYFRARAVLSTGEEGEWVEMSVPVSSRPIVINEIMYNPEPGSDNYCEYIELYNNSPFDVDLKDWKISTNNEQPVVAQEELSTVIKSAGYALITDEIDEENNFYDPAICGYNIPEYSDNAIRLYKKDNDLILNNTGMAIIIKNEKSENIDSVTYDKNWGANGTGVSLERIRPSAFSMQDPINWKESPIGGTPNLQNNNLNENFPSGISGGSIVQDSFWTKKFSPYLIKGIPVVLEGITLTIEPGVVIKFYDYQSGLTINGTLKSLGDNLEDGKIIFTSYHDDEVGGDLDMDSGVNIPAPGNWQQIFFTSTSVNSEIKNTVIRYGGEFYQTWPPCYVERGAIKIDTATVLIKDSIIEKNKNRGLRLVNSNSTIDNVQFYDNLKDCRGDSPDNQATAILIEKGNPIIQNSKFERNLYGVTISGCPDSGSQTIQNNSFKESDYPIYTNCLFPNLSENQAENNKYNGVFINGSNVNFDAKILNDLPYIFSNNLDIAVDATLTIDPGVILKFKNSLSTVFVNGTLLAIGTESLPIIFTSLKDDEYGGDTNNDADTTTPNINNWKEIKILGTADLDWLKIRYSKTEALNIQDGATVTRGENVFIEPKIE